MLSIVIPAFNEEKNITDAVESVFTAMNRISQRFEFEVIVVNDGSSDGTHDAVEKLAKKYENVRAIHRETNHGVGSGFMLAVSKAKYDKVTTFPGDNSLSIDYMENIFKHVPVTETLFTYVSNSKDRGFFRYQLSGLYHRIYATTFRLPIRYIHGTPVYSKKLVIELAPKSLSYSFFSELAVKMLRSGVTYSEIPGEVHGKQTGGSSALRWKVLADVISTYLRLVSLVYFGERSRFSNRSQYKVITGSEPEFL